MAVKHTFFFFLVKHYAKNGALLKWSISFKTTILCLVARRNSHNYLSMLQWDSENNRKQIYCPVNAWILSVQSSIKMNEFMVCIKILNSTISSIEDKRSQYLTILCRQNYWQREIFEGELSGRFSKHFLRSKCKFFSSSVKNFQFPRQEVYSNW